MRQLFFAILTALFPLCAKAEVDACNSDRVLGLLLSKTFEATKSAQLAELRKGVAEEFKSNPPYTCPPHTPPRELTYRAGSNNAPYNPDDHRGRSATGQQVKPSAPLTAADYLALHQRACALTSARLKDEESRRENIFNERKSRIDELTSQLAKADAKIVNIRQREFDGQNNRRLCIADFEYTSFRPTYISPQPSACS